MSIVVDSSVSLAWAYSDEATPAVIETLRTLIAEGAWVPGIWRLEVANALSVGIRRGRADAAFLDSTLADLAQLPIREDPDTSLHAWGATMRLAGKHSLTTYDASYLELALRRSIPLATLDRQLRAAATKESVSLLGL
ncbi:MAG TPA: type II toxin-antitoxin system VapC family toxin [Terracidiphilus sp.]|jgi:predicted nucleic acid-binding protein|nr:type II toxin-antitoxin system VapC family toxin [Terracidiphilus sp.]